MAENGTSSTISVQSSSDPPWDATGEFTFTQAIGTGCRDLNYCSGQGWCRSLLPLLPPPLLLPLLQSMRLFFYFLEVGIYLASYINACLSRGGTHISRSGFIFFLFCFLTRSKMRCSPLRRATCRGVRFSLFPYPDRPGIDILL